MTDKTQRTIARLIDVSLFILSALVLALVLGMAVGVIHI
jgi:hypothetical protein